MRMVCYCRWNLAFHMCSIHHGELVVRPCPLGGDNFICIFSSFDKRQMMEKGERSTSGLYMLLPTVTPNPIQPPHLTPPPSPQPASPSPSTPSPPPFPSSLPWRTNSSAPRAQSASSYGRRGWAARFLPSLS